MSYIFRTIRRFQAVASISAALFAGAACSDSSTEPTRTAASVVVSPAERALVAGEQLQLAARALDASGRELSGRTVSWSSSDVSIASVTDAGLVSAIRAGAVFIRATADGKTGTAALQIAPAPVATLTVDVTQAALVEGETRALTAVAKDAAGNVLTGRVIVWESVNPNVATVSNAGLVTAVSAGTVIVRASAEGKIAQSNVTVTAAPVASVEVSEAAFSIEEGMSKLITALAKDAAGRVLNARAFTWSSDDVSVAIVDNAGRITALSTGRANVRVTSETRTATVAVTVTGPRVASVTIAPAMTPLEIGEMRQLEVVVRDGAGRVLTNRAVVWTTSVANATVSNTGLLTGRRNGPVTINASVEGVAGSAATIVVAGPPYAWDLLYHRFLAGVQEIFTQVMGISQAPVRINAGTVSRAPTASPSGARIAFAVSMTDLTTGNPVHDIFAVDRDGMNVKQLTSLNGFEDVPSWSPDGSRIAFVHWLSGGRADVWTMRPDGTDLLNLTADMVAGVHQGMPAWSPDGSRIAFVQSISDGQGTTAKIWTMRADGSDKREVTSTLTGFDSSPTWSADGQRIAFMRYFNADADIAIVPSNGGAVTRIPLPGLQSAPSWSPDGHYIAFQQIDGPLTNIYTMRADGTSIRLRTVDPQSGGGLGPRWIRAN